MAILRAFFDLTLNDPSQMINIIIIEHDQNICNKLKKHVFEDVFDELN